MNLVNLIVMQADLRYYHEIKEMADYVKNGGFWTEQVLKEYSTKMKLNRTSPLIAINLFEDGLFYLHDGLHRCSATLLGGRNYLREDEYFVTKWTYQEYIDIEPKNNWYTPFDPRIHVRTADFSNFKQKAKDIFANLPLEEAVKWVNDNLGQFRTNRTLTYLPEFTDKISKLVY